MTLPCSCNLALPTLLTVQVTSCLTSLLKFGVCTVRQVLTIQETVMLLVHDGIIINNSSEFWCSLYSLVFWVTCTTLPIPKKWSRWRFLNSLCQQIHKKSNYVCGCTVCMLINWVYVHLPENPTTFLCLCEWSFDDGANFLTVVKSSATVNKMFLPLPKPFFVTCPPFFCYFLLPWVCFYLSAASVAE